MNRFQPKGRSRTYASTGLFVIVVYLFIWMLALTGWVMNIFTIVKMWSDPVTAELVVRIIGVPVGFIGAVFGWF